MEDKDRALNKSREEIWRTGAVFNLNEGIEVEEGGILTRLVAWPGNGTRMVAWHTITHRPGTASEMHSHPISEECMMVVKGVGQAFIGGRWITILPGDVFYAPPKLLHATRNLPGSDVDFIVMACSAPPQIEFYQRIGFFKNGLFDFEAIDKALARSVRGNISIVDETTLNDTGEDQRAEIKGAAEVSRSGGIFNVYRGAPFYANGASMRFAVWPGAGSRMITCHAAIHGPGEVFRPHIHPISEDAIVCNRGVGQGHLNGRWIHMDAGDILYAPAGITHGTGCPADYPAAMHTNGCACPPQMDLYERGGYLVDGRFVDSFEWSSQSAAPVRK